MAKHKIITRDLSWLSFNARVLQEAADRNVPLKERIKFLGIFSNNLDEFFRVRVAALKRMAQLNTKDKSELSPQAVLDEIQFTVLNQQGEFARIWEEVQEEMKAENIFLITNEQLNPEQQEYVQELFDNEISSSINPLMIENIHTLPTLRDKSIFLGIVMWKKESALKKKYALIEIPSRFLGRFKILPSPPGQHHIILLEDIIRYSLPEIFAYFGYDKYSGHIFKVTRDAELDLESDLSQNIIQKIEKGLKNRRKGKPVRFVYDKEMDPGLLEYLIVRLNLSRKDNLLPGGRIHNFKHFMDFPSDGFKNTAPRKNPFDHPKLNDMRISELVFKEDIMLHFPYHSFNPLIDIIREAAFDPDVTTIKITCYRLAGQSKIINALINAVRNGKIVVVMLELQARFDEEANLEWKERLEEEGAKVLVDIPNLKVHSKICLIKKKINNVTKMYGFVSTGNMNEKTARVYADHCLITSNYKIMLDVSRIFTYLENYKTKAHVLKLCRNVLPSPGYVRKELYKLIDFEISQAEQKKPAEMILKMNSLSDEGMIIKLQEAAVAGVKIQLIIRGICSLYTENKKFKHKIKAISIIDEYLEHARVWIFHNAGNEKVFISSADWMTRNVDYRVEASCPIWNEEIKQELKDILNIQLSDNVKARTLDNELSNDYMHSEEEKKVRSQIETYNYLYNKINNIEVSSN